MYVTTLAYNLEVSSFKINILNIYNKMPYECNASFLFILLRPVESKPDHIFPKQLKCYKTFLFFVFFPNGMIWCHCNPFKISNNIIHLQEQAFFILAPHRPPYQANSRSMRSIYSADLTVWNDNCACRSQSFKNKIYINNDSFNV